MRELDITMAPCLNAPEWRNFRAEDLFKGCEEELNLTLDSPIISFLTHVLNETSRADKYLDYEERVAAWSGLAYELAMDIGSFNFPPEVYRGGVQNRLESDVSDNEKIITIWY